MSEIVKVGEVLAPGERTLRELADAANSEHRSVVEAGVSMVEHAIRAGEALLAAETQCKERVRAGEQRGLWGCWREENFDGGKSASVVYMRLARHQEEIRARGIDTIKEARRYLIGVGAPRLAGGPKPPPEWFIAEMKRLRAEGRTLQSIADELGVSRIVVTRWVVPGAREQMAERNRRHLAKRRAAARALRDREQQRAIRQAVRKAGGALAEAYAVAERMQDVLGQAHREAEDQEARRALSLAGEHYRKMRDEIVTALGVSPGPLSRIEKSRRAKAA